MENYRMPERKATRDDSTRERSGSLQRGQKRESAPASFSPASSLIVGAKTLAGVGIGLLAVVAGSAVIGVAAEAILIPSLLLKLAGGVAGGGLGMAKGLKDAQKR